MARPPLSESQEDYLKEIYKFSEINPVVNMQALAKKLQVKPPSVTGMVRKLASMKLVTYAPYKGVELTESGKKVALEIIRHHRLLELYLARHLNYSWDEIHDEAERLEHVISEKFEAAIAEMMGHPTHDPHGDPIPNADLELPDSVDYQPAATLKPGTLCIIKRVLSQDSDVLSLFSRLDLVIGQSIEIADTDAAGLRIRIEGNQYLLPHSMARLLLCDIS